MNNRPYSQKIVFFVNKMSLEFLFVSDEIVNNLERLFWGNKNFDNNLKNYRHMLIIFKILDNVYYY